MMETDENDRIVVIAYQTVTCAASSVSNWVLSSRQLTFFYAFLSSFVAAPVSVPNSSKIQNTAAVASLNNPRQTKTPPASPVPPPDRLPSSNPEFGSPSPRPGLRLLPSVLTVDLGVLSQRVLGTISICWPSHNLSSAKSRQGDSQFGF